MPDADLEAADVYAAAPPRAKRPIWVFIPDLMVARGNLNTFFQSIRAAGAWAVRFFLLQSWSTSRLVPWKQAVYQGQNVRLYSAKYGVNAPVCDMTQINTEYWLRLRSILALLKQNYLEAVVSLGDNCSQSPRQVKRSYPFMSSLNTMSKQEAWPLLDPPDAREICTPSTGGLYGPSKYPLFRSWVASAVAVLKASGVPFYGEIQNEFSRLGWPDSAPEPRNWYVMMNDAVRAAGVGIGHILHSGDKSIVLEFPGIFSMHRICQAGMYPTTVNPNRLMLSGDGGYSGDFPGRSLTDLDAKGRRGVSVPDAIAIAKMIRAKEIVWGYEWMPRRAWKYDNNNANVDGLLTDVPAAMTAEWAK